MSTEEVKETVQAYQPASTVSRVDKAIADAQLLQEKGPVAEALKK